jgi:hypothetical protein
MSERLARHRGCLTRVTTHVTSPCCSVDEDVVLKPQRRLSKHETLRFSSDDARRSVTGLRCTPRPPGARGRPGHERDPADRTADRTSARPDSAAALSKLSTYNDAPDLTACAHRHHDRGASRAPDADLHIIFTGWSRLSPDLHVHFCSIQDPANLPHSPKSARSPTRSLTTTTCGAAAVMCGRASSRAADDVSMYEPLCTRAIHLLDLMPSRMPSRMQASPSSPM